MKMLRNFTALIAFAVFLFSCRKENSVEVIKAVPDIDAQWEFTEAEQIYSGDTDSGYIQSTEGVKILTVTGKTADGNGQIFLQMIGENIAEGNYHGLHVFFQYADGDAVLLESNPDQEGGDFSITITSIDSSSVSGIFSGTVQDGMGNLQTISEGKFTAKLAAPLLSDSYFPLTNSSSWQYNDISAPSSTNITHVLGEKTIDGRLYKELVNSFGDTTYYRNNEPHVYYQYVSLDFGGLLKNPPQLELAILHDDYEDGQQWETPSLDANYSGLPIKIKLVSSITQKDFSNNYNGKTYNHLIEVTSELWVSIDGGANFQATGSIYVTVFAKGVGIVDYEDLERGVEWNIDSFYIAP